MTEILIIAVVFIAAILALILPQKPKTNSKPLNLEDLVQIQTETNLKNIRLQEQEDESYYQMIKKEADKQVNNFTTQQYNFEGKSTLGNVFAIKVDQHRFYTLQMTNGNYREIFICRYGKKESQKNDKELTTTIKSIDKIEIQKIEL